MAASLHVEKCADNSAFQSYFFEGMMVNEFEKRTYSCGSDCRCMYSTELESECRISGLGVLKQYGFKTGRTGEWVGILLAIVLVYRLLGLGAMMWKK